MRDRLQFRSRRKMTVDCHSTFLEIAGPARASRKQTAPSPQIAGLLTSLSREIGQSFAHEECGFSLANLIQLASSLAQSQLNCQSTHGNSDVHETKAPSCSLPARLLLIKHRPCSLKSYGATTNLGRVAS